MNNMNGIKYQRSCSEMSSMSIAYRLPNQINYAQDLPVPLYMLVNLGLF